MQAVLVAIALLFLFGCAATAEEPVVLAPPAEAAVCPGNLELSYWLGQWGIENAEPMDAEQRLKLLSAFNNHPPVSDYNPEEIYVIGWENAYPPFARIIFVDGLCITLSDDVPLDLFISWMSAEDA